MNYYQRLEEEAADELRVLLNKPLSEHDAPSVEEFDPWEIFPLYGSYSSEFDEVALRVLRNIRDSTRTGENVAHEMFREMLCKKGLCDYGTSPRVCFPTERFKQMLPEYIDKWDKYSERTWSES